MNTDRHPAELPLPPSVDLDPHARELARIWAADGKQVVTFPTSLWKNPETWGIMLVDFAKHVADAYRETTDLSFEMALARIRQGFDMEWSKPTDSPSGSVTDE